MREIFAASEPRDPGRVFYTIRKEDLKKAVIMTEIGLVNLAECLGRVLPCDVGKRIYRVPNNAGDWWFWQVENDAQFKRRTGEAKP